MDLTIISCAIVVMTIVTSSNICTFIYCFYRQPIKAMHLYFFILTINESNCKTITIDCDKSKKHTVT